MQVVRGNLSFAMPGAMLATAFLLLNAPTAAADNNASEAIATLELSRMTLEDLGKIEISSVSRKQELLGDLGWKISTTMDLSLSGFNLLNKRHAEFGAFPNCSVLGRSVYVKLGWSF
jgi:hypothetical protein